MYLSVVQSHTLPGILATAEKALRVLLVVSAHTISLHHPFLFCTFLAVLFIFRRVSTGGYFKDISQVVDIPFESG